MFVAANKGAVMAADGRTAGKGNLSSSLRIPSMLRSIPTTASFLGVFLRAVDAFKRLPQKTSLLNTSVLQDVCG